MGKTFGANNRIFPSQYLFKMTYHRALNLIAKKEIINRAEAVFYTKNQEIPEDVNYYQNKRTDQKN